MPAINRETLVAPPCWQSMDWWWEMGDVGETALHNGIASSWNFKVMSLQQETFWESWLFIIEMGRGGDPRMMHDMAMSLLGS